MQSHAHTYVGCLFADITGQGYNVTLQLFCLRTVSSGRRFFFFCIMCYYLCIMILDLFVKMLDRSIMRVSFFMAW